MTIYAKKIFITALFDTFKMAVLHVITILSGFDGTLVCSLTGLDYVGHEDILPYTTTEKQPIHNHLFDKFLTQDSESSTFKQVL